MSFCKGLMINGRLFESANAVVETGLASTVNAVRKRIYKKQYPDYYYVTTEVANKDYKNFPDNEMDKD